MLTYKEAAEHLGVPHGTLARRVTEYNARAEAKPEEGLEQILPDVVENHGHYQKYLFDFVTVERMRAALVNTGKRGRPKKKQND